MSNDTLDFPYGYAVRRNKSCLDSEVDCGNTWNDEHACCPSSTRCPNSSDTSVCCPSTKDCTGSLVGPNTHCGDDTANLYYVSSQRNYFCCANNTNGFIVDDYDYVGCTTDIKDLEYNVKAASLISSASESTPITSITATPTATSNLQTTSEISTTTITPTATDEATSESSPSHSNVGAIAGGVVGGVCGAAILVALGWYLLFKRRRKGPSDENDRLQTSNNFSQEPQELPVDYTTAGNTRTRGQLEEIGVGKESVLAELPTDR